MRVASYRTAEGRVSYGLVDPDVDLNDSSARVADVGQSIAEAPDDVVSFMALGAPEREEIVAGVDFTTGAALSSLDLLPAVPTPTNIICIGVNYVDHAVETGVSVLEYPVIFMKFSSAIAAHGQGIVKPAETTQLDFEAELGVLITKQASDVSEEDALDYVGGYFTLNDVSARDFQNRTGQWVQGKSFPTFAPTGPFMLTVDEIPDPQVMSISLTVNGEIMQNQSTADMIFSVRSVVSYLSKVGTLQPGDVIATGTPSGIGASRDPQVFLQEGDVVRVMIDGLPDLENTVVGAG